MTAIPLNLSLDVSFITSLIRILLDVPSSVDSQQQFATFAGRIVTDIVVPNSVWKGGRYGTCTLAKIISTLCSKWFHFYQNCSCHTYSNYDLFADSLARKYAL